MNARNEILKAADQLFGEVGFDAATTREIAERSGVNKALIHYHFQSKEALYENVLDRYYQRLNQLLLEQLGREGDLRQRMERLVEVYVDFLARNLNFSRIVQRESSGERHLERIRRHLAPVFGQGVEILVSSYPSTRSGDLSAPQLLVSFYGMIVSYFTYSRVLEGLIGRDPLSAAELEQRKSHLKKMLNLVMGELERERKKKPGRK